MKENKYLKLFLLCWPKIITVFPIAIHGEGVPAKRAGKRSDNAVNNPSRINSPPSINALPAKHRLRVSISFFNF